MNTEQMQRELDRLEAYVKSTRTMMIACVSASWILVGGAMVVLYAHTADPSFHANLLQFIVEHFAHHEHTH